jgi:cysteine desulfurase/selenocysteine lyase
MPIGTSVFAQSFAMPGTEALLARLPASAGQASVGLPGVGADAQQRFGFLADVPAAQSMPGAATPLFLPSTFDVHAVRRDFPILSERVNGRPLVWFDNAATTQKPQAVIDRLTYFYEHENSNIHRAAHELAARATDAYEGARETVRRFLGARFTDEIVFVRGSTEAINLVAKSWGAQNIGAGDEIILSHLEHHANIVPWQQLAAEKGAKLRVIPVDDSGQVLLDAYQQLLNPRTKMVAVTQVSNALGTVVPVHEIVARAHQAGACVLIDGAQSVSHMRVDMQSLDADFFVFSGHKIFGPTGIGVLYGKRAVLEKMPPWQGGGNMIVDVTFEKTVFQGPPGRFEAGTGNIADAVGLGAALEYVERIGIEAIGAYEHALLEYATRNMEPIPGVRLIGTAQEKASVLSFVMEGKETEEVGQALNAEGIAVRTGHHCAQPILRRFGLETTVRPSLAFYNTCEEVDRMVAVVRQLAGTGR